MKYIFSVLVGIPLMVGANGVAFAQTGSPSPATAVDAPQSTSSTVPLRPRPPMNPADRSEALRRSHLPMINGMPYDQPSSHDLAAYYVHDTYGVPGFQRSIIRALYGEARGKPTGWGQDFAGFSQRFGSAVAVTSINGSVRLGFEFLLHEDLRYIPCPSCKWGKKIINALLAEFTARHGEDGHRAFTLSPTIADFAGPIIAHSIWYPGGSDPFAGVVATRVVVGTRVGSHLIDEAIAAYRYKHAKK